MAFFDVNKQNNPENFGEARTRLQHMMLGATEHQVESGLTWYPKGERAAREGSASMGVSHLRGAGMMSAVSPGLDFDQHNVGVLEELDRMRPEHAKMVMQSAQLARIGQQHNRELKAAGILKGSPEYAQHAMRTGRLPEVTSMLTEAYPSLSKAYDANISTALHIRGGEDPIELLSRRTSPKQHNFMLNLAGDTDAITIDGRHADIIANEMRAWHGAKSARGIGTAGNLRGTPTRHEDYEEVVRSSSKLPSVRKKFPSMTPRDAQALQWVVAKDLERTKPDGSMRAVGPKRAGQPYI
jgi:hypothetical protein